MIDKIKLLLGLTNDNSKDNLLQLLIDMATEEAINYTHNEHIADLSSAICSMVVYQYNRLGTEGLNSENYSGVTFNYSQDYPDNIMRQLRTHRKVRTID